MSTHIDEVVGEVVSPPLKSQAPDESASSEKKIQDFPIEYHCELARRLDHRKTRLQTD